MAPDDPVCPACGGSFQHGDEFCPGCGEALPEEVRAASARRPRTARTVRGRFAEQSRRGKVKAASVWILVLAGLFGLFGTIYGFKAKSDAEEAHRVLSLLEDDQPIPVEGKLIPAGELRRRIDREVIALFATNYLLAAILIGIFFWARVHPVPAFTTAFVLFLIVQVVNLVVDPETLFQGIVIKAIVIVVFLGGIKAALAERAAARAGPVPARARARARVDASPGTRSRRR